MTITVVFVDMMHEDKTNFDSSERQYIASSFHWQFHILNCDVQNLVYRQRTEVQNHSISLNSQWNKIIL